MRCLGGLGSSLEALQLTLRRIDAVHKSVEFICTPFSTRSGPIHNRTVHTGDSARSRRRIYRRPRYLVLRDRIQQLVKKGVGRVHRAELLQRYRRMSCLATRVDSNGQRVRC